MTLRPCTRACSTSATVKPALRTRKASGAARISCACIPHRSFTSRATSEDTSRRCGVSRWACKRSQRTESLDKEMVIRISVRFLYHMYEYSIICLDFPSKPVPPQNYERIAHSVSHLDVYSSSLHCDMIITE